MIFTETMKRNSAVILNNCTSRAKGLGTRPSEEVFKEYQTIRKELGINLTMEDKIYLFEIADFYMKQLEKERKKSSKAISKKLEYDSEDALPALKKIYGEDSMEVSCYALYLGGASVDTISERLNMSVPKTTYTMLAIEKELKKYEESEIYRALTELNFGARNVNSRVSNALMQHGIYDVVTLKEYEFDAIQKYRNIGTKGIEVLKALYDAY